jgi:GEVED domain
MNRSLFAVPLCLLLVAVPGVAQYCASTSNLTNCNNVEEYISNVTIGTLNNNSACLNAPSYEDYTALPAPTLTQASGHAISVTITEWYSSTDTVTVFCDWNGNNLLNDAGEVYPLAQGAAAPGGNVAYTGTITPPVGAVASTRMRVKTVYGSSGNPCGASSWSNTEDYTVNTSPPTGLVAVGTATPNPVAALTTVLFEVAVSATSPPMPPVGVFAQINLSLIGGSPTQQMYDDGVTGGDAVAGDNIFSWSHAPAGNGVFLLPFGAIDNIGRIAQSTVSISVTPANDACASATVVYLGTNGPYSNVFATDSGVIGTCSTGYKDVWFQFTPPCTGAYKLDTCSPSLFDTVLSVYDACGGNELACNDDGGTGCGFTSTIPSLTLTSGSTVFIRVASYSSSATGAFNLNINQVFTLAFSSPFGPGSLQFNLNGGPLAGTYFLALTLAPGGFPNGWLYGIDITFPDIVSLLTIGYPFVGPLDPCGNSQFGPIFGAPSGLTLYAVGLASNGPVLALPTHTTPPVTFSIL